MSVPCNAYLQDNNLNNLCTLTTCCLAQAFVNYRPSPVGNGIYLGIFALLLILQVGLGIYHRTWTFMVLVALGLIGEVIGYAGRLLMYNNPFTLANFLTYLIPLTIAPAFLSAAIYLNLGRIVVVYGAEFSYFRPGTYTITFVIFDLLSLVLQAVGGALTSSANTPSATQTGVNIMIAGLAFQVASLFVFMLAAGYFAYNVYRFKNQAFNPNFARLRQLRRFKLFLFALALATVTIFIRCCYRVAELSKGFSSAIANNQTEFFILEGPMIMIAVIALTIWHPGYGFAGNHSATRFRFRKSKQQQLDSGLMPTTEIRSDSDSEGQLKKNSQNAGAISE